MSDSSDVLEQSAASFLGAAVITLVTLKVLKSGLQETGKTVAISMSCGDVCVPAGETSRSHINGTTSVASSLRNPVRWRSRYSGGRWGPSDEQILNQDRTWALVLVTVSGKHVVSTVLSITLAEE